MLIVEHPHTYLWKNAKLRGPKKPTKEHLIDPYAVKARRSMAAFAAPPSRRAPRQPQDEDASGSPPGTQPGRTRRKKKKNKKNKRKTTPVAAGEPPAYTRWMVNKCLRCGGPHLVATCPIAKEEDDQKDAEKATIKAFKDEAKAVRAKRDKWIKEQQ